MNRESRNHPLAQTAVILIVHLHMMKHLWSSMQEKQSSTFHLLRMMGETFVWWEIISIEWFHFQDFYRHVNKRFTYTKVIILIVVFITILSSFTFFFYENWWSVFISINCIQSLHNRMLFIQCARFLCFDEQTRW